MLQKLLASAKTSPYLCFKDGVFVFSDTNTDITVFDVHVDKSAVSFFEINDKEKEKFKNNYGQMYHVYAEGIHLGIMTEDGTFFPMMTDQQRSDTQEALYNERSEPTYDPDFPF